MKALSPGHEYKKVVGSKSFFSRYCYCLSSIAEVPCEFCQVFLILSELSNPEFCKFYVLPGIKACFQIRILDFLGSATLYMHNGMGVFPQNQCVALKRQLGSSIFYCMNTLINIPCVVSLF